MSTAQTQVRAGCLLDTVNSVQLMLAADHDPDTYYRTRPGFCVWDSFRLRVIAKAGPTPAGTSFAVNVHELACNATDEEIEASLPQNHLFDESAVCAVIAEMVRRQPSDEPGKRENHGHAYLLFTRLCIVSAYRGGLRHSWRVSSWDRVDLEWSAGCRVLSPRN